MQLIFYEGRRGSADLSRYRRRGGEVSLPVREGGRLSLFPGTKKERQPRTTKRKEINVREKA